MAEQHLLWTLGGIALLLIAGSAVRLLRPDPARLASLRTWWILFIVLGACLLLGRLALVGLMAGLSLLALRELVRLAARRVEVGRLGLWAAACVILHYGIIGLGAIDAARVALPLMAFVVLTVRAVVGGRVRDFTTRVGVLFWGVMLTGYGLSHAALILFLGADPSWMGAFLVLVLLTEGNDIAQALVGRRLGTHQLAPTLSPNKSWEGFVGGWLCTTGAALLLGPWLTPLAAPPPGFSGWGASPLLWSGLAGTLIAVAGVLGDLTVSGVKREAGVKDSGEMLPGQGGLLDRVDSLSLSAPAFFYYLWALYG